jgi:hypothetical protein
MRLPAAMSLRPNSRNRISFLRANTTQDIETNRGLWRNVAAQLRNRTMPPVDSKLSEDDRLRVASWIDNRLRVTACAAGERRKASLLDDSTLACLAPPRQRRGDCAWRNLGAGADVTRFVHHVAAPSAVVLSP